MFRRQLQRSWDLCVVAISVPQVVVAALLLIGADTVYDQLGDSLIAGIFDEVAHLSTALLCLNLLPARWRRPILLPALLASVLIDLDHVPQYLFGTHALTAGTPRPYTHSLTTVLALALLALAWRRRRLLWTGVAVGLLAHFLRDLAEGSGAGVSLLWPLSTHAFGYNHALYLAIMGAVVALNLLRRRARRALPALAAALLIGGCGASGGTASAPVSAAGLFHHACGVCHSLGTAPRRSQQGGDAAGSRLSGAQLAQLIAEMPRLHGPLSASQVRVLTRYVAAHERAEQQRR